MGHMTTVTENVNLSNYVATVTTDANGNITEIEEVRDVLGTPTTVSVNTFEYDRENRLIEQTVDSNQSVAVAHSYDGLGRLVRTSRTVSGPTTTEYRHVRDGLKVTGNIDYTNSNTAPTWTNKPNGLMPIESQQLQRFPAINDGAPGFKWSPANTYGYSRSDYSNPRPTVFDITCLQALYGRNCDAISRRVERCR